ncbi:MAG TPA: diaminopimelate decarboxylase [Streptosporangiaceae bacterium]|nr:diaminopimelate decarboxylase [Streptosporangiaceae bacterium]
MDRSPVDLSLLPRTARAWSDGTAIGGVDLVAAAREFGTPLFVYDSVQIAENFAEAAEIFGPGVAYATKAFLCKAVARLAYDCGMSLDVSTAGEYHVARVAGVPASKLVVHGNNKSDGEVERAVSEGVQWLVLDSFDDIDRVRAATSRLGKSCPVLVRVNPGVEVHTHRFTATGNRNSKFGFPLWTGDAPAAVDLVRDSPLLDFKGLHIHVGSLVFAIDNFISALDSVLDLVRAVDPEVFVVGGGLGVRYLREDDAPSFREWSDAILQHCKNSGVRARVLAEPGRSMVAAAAVTLYTVGSIATKGARTYLAVDGGMSDNPRPLLYGSGYEVFLPRSPLAPRDKLVTVVGRHCESGDTLVEHGTLPSSVAIGDVVSTPVTGAYGYCMASNYNVLTRPAIVWVADGDARLIVRRETFDDLLRCDLG